MYVRRAAQQRGAVQLSQIHPGASVGGCRLVRRAGQYKDDIRRKVESLAGLELIPQDGISSQVQIYCADDNQRSLSRREMPFGYRG